MRAIFFALLLAMTNGQELNSDSDSNPICAPAVFQALQKQLQTEKEKVHLNHQKYNDCIGPIVDNWNWNDFNEESLSATIQCLDDFSSPSHHTIAIMALTSVIDNFESLCKTPQELYDEAEKSYQVEHAKFLPISKSYYDCQYEADKMDYGGDFDKCAALFWQYSEARSVVSAYLGQMRKYEQVIGQKKQRN